MAAARQLKRSISLEHGLDIEDDDVESYKQVISRRSKRKMAKKAKSSGDTQSLEQTNSANSTNDINQVNNSVNHSQFSQMSVEDSQQSLNEDSSSSQSMCNTGCNCQAVIELLKTEMSQLKETVKFLKSQADILSATLGVTFSTPVQADPVNGAASISSDTTTTSTDDHSKKSYASVAGAAGSAATPAVRQIQRNMVSAVYIDLEEKKKRASNIVICGLKGNEMYDDKAVAAGMLCQEFGRQVAIKTCRRLGKKVADKVQNLLVTLESADEAAYLVTNAKSLRQSQNEFVRRNIYINPDHTPAEAKAAYDLRCARRSRRANGANAVSVAQVAPAEESVLHTLSVSAVPFVPAASHGSGSTQANSGRPSSGRPPL